MDTLARSFAAALVLASGAACLATTARAETRTPLTVYSSYVPEDLRLLEEAFERSHPEIDVVFLRDLPGVIAARLLAEKDDRHADVVNGLAATSLERLDEAGLLEPYAPKGVERLDARFHGKGTPPHWVGMGVYGTVVCFNTKEAEAKGLPRPSSWADLAAPAYAGQVLMPNPASSDIGFLAISAWLQTMGEEKGWAFTQTLDKNIAHYTHSASQACARVSSGEYAVGISFDMRAAREKAKGAPIDVLFMAEGAGWDVDAFAILKGTDKLDAAKAFADWSASEEAMALYAKVYPIVAMPGMAKDIPGLPPGLADHMVDNNLAWAAANRQRIVAEWERRYGTRGE